jgi:hypothetical protein
MVVVRRRRRGHGGGDGGYRVMINRRLRRHHGRRIVAVAALQQSKSGQGEHDDQPPQKPGPGGRRLEAVHAGRLPNDGARPLSTRRVAVMTTPPGSRSAVAIRGQPRRPDRLVARHVGSYTGWCRQQRAASPRSSNAGTPPVRSHEAARRTVRSSCALRATTMVEADMRIAPTAGLRLKPAQARTPAASGIATTLYPAAQARFWIIFR